LELESEIIASIHILNNEKQLRKDKKIRNDEKIRKDEEIRKDNKIRNVVKLCQVPIVLNVLGLCPTMTEVTDTVKLFFQFLIFTVKLARLLHI
jgi:hypothetical protein